MIPIWLVIFSIIVSLSVAAATIFFVLRAGHKMWIAISASLFPILMSIILILWVTCSICSDGIAQTNFYEIKNINYSDDVIGQIYVNNEKPYKCFSILDGVVYDTDLYHAKVDTYKTNRLGILWAANEKVEIVKKNYIRKISEKEFIDVVPPRGENK